MHENKVKKAMKHLIDAHAELVRAINTPIEDTDGAVSAAIMNAEWDVVDAAKALGYGLPAVDYLEANHAD